MSQLVLEIGDNCVHHPAHPVWIMVCISTRSLNINSYLGPKQVLMLIITHTDTASYIRDIFIIITELLITLI